MSRFDLLYRQTFTNTDTVVIVHNLNRNVFNVRHVISGDPRLSRRELVEDIILDPTDPLNKLTVKLTGIYTGTIQLIAEDTIQSPYYTVEEKIAAQTQTELAGTAPVKFEYGGNANTGRVLEYVTGEASDDEPFIVISDGKLRGVTFGAFSSSTGSIGIYAIRNGSDTLLHTISFSSSIKEINKPLDIDILEDDEIYAKVDSGNSNKPYVVVYVQTI